MGILSTLPVGMPHGALKQLRNKLNNLINPNCIIVTQNDLEFNDETLDCIISYPDISDESVVSVMLPNSDIIKECGIDYTIDLYNKTITYTCTKLPSDEININDLQVVVRIINL